MDIFIALSHLADVSAQPVGAKAQLLKAEEMKGLTEKQRKMLDFIEDFMGSAAMAPTVYEIADHFKIKTSTVFAHLRALQRKNYLTRSSKARSIALKAPRKRKRRQQNGNEALSVPMIAHDGAKRCELFCDMALLDRDIDRSGLFALKVQGHGLKDDGIFEGDIVVVRPSSGEIKAGEIVVIMGKEGIVELKRHEHPSADKAQGGPEVQSEMIPPPIKGVVVALQRKI
jgi:repressor LexA